MICDVGVVRVKAEAEALSLSQKKEKKKATIEIRGNLSQTKPSVLIFTDALSVLNKFQNAHQKDLNEVETVLADLAAQANPTLQWIPAHCRIKGNEQADRLAREGGPLDQEDRYTSYTDEKTIIKALAMEAATPTDWTDQNRSFCSGWALGTTDLMSTCTASSGLVSLRCARATQTLWLQNNYYSTANYMMLWGGARGQNQNHWGTSSMVTWRS